MNIFNKSLVLAACSAIAIAFDANGLSITPSSPVPIFTSNTQSNSALLAEINAFLDPDPTLAYKQNVGGSEEGPFAASVLDSVF